MLFRSNSDSWSTLSLALRSARTFATPAFANLNKVHSMEVATTTLTITFDNDDMKVYMHKDMQKGNQGYMVTETLTTLTSGSVLPVRLLRDGHSHPLHRCRDQCMYLDRTLPVLPYPVVEYKVVGQHSECPGIDIAFNQQRVVMHSPSND